MNHDFFTQLAIAHKDARVMPPACECVQWCEDVVRLLFPGSCQKRITTKNEIELELRSLQVQLERVLISIDNFESFGLSNHVELFFQKLPEIRDLLKTDIKAIFDGDPAAQSEAEVVLSYPGFFAIARHRIAHELYLLNIPLLPRIISENTHQKTGIDIHPGAQIQGSFCIDHGTGIVIGETCQIGKGVKIYQGVTLGALSVSKEMCDTKRHPTIEDDVVIYANATILGGKTTIGKGSIIGGSVWVTGSLEVGSKVYYKSEVEINS